VFGGMLAATILTLIFVPVFYAVIESFRERRGSTESPHATDGHRLEPTARPAE